MTTRTSPDRFVHREGTTVVSPPGLPAFRRGMGLGGWLLPEGYMWKIDHGAVAPRTIEAMVASLLGADDARGFWQRYRREFITRADVAAIAAAGFDHVRVPINARLVMAEDGGADALLPVGIGLVDDVIAWCRAEGITCVLDLHGAPGGQTGTNIDDSPRGLPELFTDDEQAARTVRLWEMLAERYRDEPTVACYDLLNEPLPDEHADLVPRLVELYRELTAAIRRIDTHHLLSYEGNNWATRFELFDDLARPSADDRNPGTDPSADAQGLDDNSVLHFHKYWSTPDTDSIAPYLQARERLGRPLWMGESGENTEQWYREAFGLFEQHQIPWTFWTWKKVDGPTSPVVVSPPARWDELVAFAEGTGPAPDRPQQILDELLDNLALERATLRPEVFEALGTVPPPHPDEPSSPTPHTEGSAQ
jgi:endoglucanase